MKLNIKKGTTSKLIDLFIQDSSSTTGAGLTGLVYNTASLTAYYYREGAASATAITLATMTLGTWATGGFVVVDGTNMPGCYQLGIPDAALATGANSVLVMLKGATNMAPLVLEIQLVDYDPHDAVRMGMTALPNVASGSAGAIPTTGTGANQLSVSSGQVTVGTNNDKTGYTASTVSDKTGYSLVTTPPTAAQISTQVWSEAVPGAFGAGTAGNKQGNLDAAVSSRSTYAGADTAGTTTLLSRIAAALTITGGKVDVNDKTGFSLSTAGIQAIWDALTSALTTVGSIGKLLVTNIDAAISSRNATTPPTVTAIRQEMDTNSTKLANLDAAVSSRSTYAGGAVASVTGNVGGNVVGSVASVTAPVTVGTNSDKTGYALTAPYDAAKTAASPTDVQTKVDAALDTAGTELSAVPTTTGTLRQKINFLFQYFRNKKTVTNTTETLFKEDATTTLGSATVSDDGTTFTKGEMN